MLWLPPAPRWINRMALLLFGSANLVRPGLRPNGPSDIASRHRVPRPQQQSHASIANRSDATIHIHIAGKQAS